MTDQIAQDRPAARGLPASQRHILELLKRRGHRTVGQLAERLELAAETVRGHLKTLVGHRLVHRVGHRKEGPGRPEVLYGLAEEGEALFPRGEGRLLNELTSHLVEEGHEEILEDFFRTRRARQKEGAEERLAGLEGRDRLEEVAAILTEEGFMAEVVDAEDGPRLRLCHCPLNEMVAASRLPCEAEIAWIRDLLGEELARRSWMPEGDRTCTYVMGGGPA